MYTHTHTQVVALLALAAARLAAAADPQDKQTMAVNKPVPMIGHPAPAFTGKWKHRWGAPAVYAWCDGFKAIERRACVCAHNQPPHRPTPKPNEPKPAEAVMPDGSFKELSLAQFKGKYVVLVRKIRNTMEQAL